MAACDVIFANFYPYWEGVAIDNAVATVHADYLELKDAAGGKEVIVSETGWPSAGDTIGQAVPSPANAAFYFLNLESWAQAENVKYFYFEAFDEAWKAAYEGQQGAHWEFWDKDGALKPGMDKVFQGETMPAPLRQLAGPEFPPELVSFGPPSDAPLFAGTGADTWDRNIRERGWIMREDGLWHLWYTGYNDALSDSRFLGYATSPDGLTWTRWPGNPLTREGWVEDMCVVKWGGTYYMFAEGRDDIAHLLTSTDRVHWQEQGNLDIRQTNGQPISAGPRGSPTAWFENGVWWLFYERGDLAVFAARSTDLKVWTNVTDEPVLARGPDAYDQYALAVDQVIQHVGRYYAYYHASALPTWGEWSTCLAVSDDLVHWKKYPANPVLPVNPAMKGAGSGMVVHDGTRFRLYTMHPDVRVYYPQGVPEVIVDNRDANTVRTGTWAASGGTSPFGADSVWARGGDDTFTWRFTPDQSGTYEVCEWHSGWSTRTSAAPHRITHADGSTTVSVNQKLNAGKWNSLGVYRLTAGVRYEVRVTSVADSSSTCADAVRWTLVP